MNILVTGGAGFVGTNLIKRLLKDGHNVVSLDNYSTGKKENEQEGCTYFDVDIRDVVDFSYFMEKPDVIYHLGAIARIQPSFQYPANTLEVGILGTMNILEWVRELENKPRMINYRLVLTDGCSNSKLWRCGQNFLFLHLLLTRVRHVTVTQQVQQVLVLVPHSVS